MTALLLLGPWTPLLFQGQEFGSSKRFMFFTDVGDGDMREAIRKGRFKFLAQFQSLANKEVQKDLPSPSDPDVFARCKLDVSERETNREFYALHVDLMKLRREDARFREQIPGGLDGAVLGQASFVLRYFASDHDDRLLVLNFGRCQRLVPAPEPLLAPPLGFEWETIWTSESPRYGGPGAVTVATQDRWLLPAEAAVALRLVPEKAPRKQPRQRRA
jgi:maltooligosyltrehalose trehalohydrolase